MNQTDVKVSFYLKKSEADARGNCPVMARLIVGKHSETAFSVKFRVPQSLWSSGRACGKSVAARDINNRLDEIRAAALGIYAEQSAIREDVTAEDWAAYKSRISAVGVLVDGNYKPLQRQYLEESDGEVPNILASLEKNAFIQLIMGEQPMDYFDTFVQEWYAQGGQELTEKIREENS